MLRELKTSCVFETMSERDTVLLFCSEGFVL